VQIRYILKGEKKVEDVKTILDYSFTAGKLGWKFIDSISTGRYKLTTMSGDLADNSDDAGATKFWTDFEGPSSEITKIIYADNGSGMDEEILEGSYTLGFERKRTVKQLGKFGVGGTMGCLNIASEKLTITRTKGGEVLARRYDLRLVKDRDCWGTITVVPTEEMKSLLDSYVGEKGSGTVIVLSKFNRKNFSLRKGNLVRNLRTYYSSTYCEKIASGNFKIFLDGEEVESIDPLYWYHKDTIKLIDKKIPGTNYRIRMVNLMNVLEARSSKRAFSVAQGGYFFRCDRIIRSSVTFEDNFKTIWKRHPEYNNVRWAVYFDADGDDDMGVTNDKCDINPTQSIADKIGELVMPEAKIIRAIVKSKRNKQSGEDKEKELSDMSDILSDLVKKEKQEDASPTIEPVENENIIVNFPKKITNDPDIDIPIPSYVIRDIALGQLAEPFRVTSNDNQSESKYILQINTEHRYTAKYYLNSSKEVRNAVISWILPFALAVIISPDTDECSLDDFRDSFNRKLTQSTSKVDRL
jgi:hypothetical protein